jgi:hypothetical protein
MGDETIRSHLHGNWVKFRAKNGFYEGKFGPPEADEVKKCAKMYVKKPNMRANIHGRTKNERR